jgi:hypothetical protein
LDLELNHPCAAPPGARAPQGREAEFQEAALAEELRYDLGAAPLLLDRPLAVWVVRIRR